MTKPYPALSLGILGGGQLARMLALKAHDLGVKVRVLSEHADDPAAQVTQYWTQGSTSDPHALEGFLRLCDVVTFESEFLDARLLGRLQKKTKVEIYPRPAQMASMQDRLTQKRLLVKHRIPTSPFMPVSTFAEARKAWEEFGRVGGFVLKKRRFGYDGNGTFMVRTREDLEGLRLEVEAGAEPGFIAERLIRFRREAACMIVRGRNGPAMAMPFVETRQENSRCLWVKGPTRLASSGRFAAKLLRFADAIGYVGALGVEIFDSADGLLVNELAPRVHNSGHYTLESLTEDQFTAHVKAVLGLPLSKPRLLAPAFAMLNLLGDEQVKTPVAARPVAPAKEAALRWSLPPDIALCWYGKAQSRPGRKMGHINAVGATANGSLKRLLAARKDFKI